METTVTLERTNRSFPVLEYRRDVYEGGRVVHAPNRRGGWQYRARRVLTPVNGLFVFFTLQPFRFVRSDEQWRVRLQFTRVKHDVNEFRNLRTRRYNGGAAKRGRKRYMRS